jgi:hypothetical protein
MKLAVSSQISIISIILNFGTIRNVQHKMCQISECYITSHFE